jgi:hypothetical protein
LAARSISHEKPGGVSAQGEHRRVAFLFQIARREAPLTQHITQQTRPDLLAALAKENPTIVVITDRNDLDGQLFATFARSRDLLRYEPEQAESRADLREKLRRGSGGVVFTMIQKFMPEERGDRHPVLSERRNIAVIADEAHRSQYDFIDGLARHLHDALPNASLSDSPARREPARQARTEVVGATQNRPRI